MPFRVRSEKSEPPYLLIFATQPSNLGLIRSPPSNWLILNHFVDSNTDFKLTTILSKSHTLNSYRRL
jgi:hypothetical protein